MCAVPEHGCYLQEMRLLMKKKKRILAVLIAAAFLLALWNSYNFRLDIIRASLEWDLPGWLQAWLWG